MIGLREWCANDFRSMAQPIGGCLAGDLALSSAVPRVNRARLRGLVETILQDLPCGINRFAKVDDGVLRVLVGRGLPPTVRGGKDGGQRWRKHSFADQGRRACEGQKIAVCNT